jgi:hypothetical protein
MSLPDAADLALEDLGEKIQKAHSEKQRCITLNYKVTPAVVQRLREKNYEVDVTDGNCDHHFCSCGSRTVIGW